jgi:hypothetical protein
MQYFGWKTRRRRRRRRRQLGKPRRRWRDNIRLDLREIGLEGAYWINLA